MGPRRRGRRRGLIVGAAIGSAAARRNSTNEPAGNNDQGSNDLATELQKLGDLRDQGILTEDEFQAKKKQLLNI